MNNFNIKIEFNTLKNDFLLTIKPPIKISESIDREALQRDLIEALNHFIIQRDPYSTFNGGYTDPNGNYQTVFDNILNKHIFSNQVCTSTVYGNNRDSRDDLMVIIYEAVAKGEMTMLEFDYAINEICRGLKADKQI